MCKSDSPTRFGSSSSKSPSSLSASFQPCARRMVFSGGLEEGFGDGNDVRSIYVPAELSAALASDCLRCAQSYSATSSWTKADDQEGAFDIQGWENTDFGATGPLDYVKIHKKKILKGAGIVLGLLVLSMVIEEFGADSPAPPAPAPAVAPPPPDVTVGAGANDAADTPTPPPPPDVTPPPPPPPPPPLGPPPPPPPPKVRMRTRAQMATPIPVDGAFHSGSTNSGTPQIPQVWSFEAVQDQTYVRPTAQLGQAQLA